MDTSNYNFLQASVRRRMLNGMQFGLFFLCSQLVFLGSAYAAEGVFSIQTSDGRARVEFNSAGRVLSLANVPLGPGVSGLFVEDPASHRTYSIGGADAPARFDQANGGLKERATIPAAKLSIEATYRFLSDGALSVDGVLTDLSGTDRVADVGFVLPLEAIGGAWQANLANETPITEEMKAVSQTDFSLAAVTGAREQYSVAYGVPPDRPQRFEINFSPKAGFTIRLKFGLSPSAAGALRSRAPFSFTIDIVSGRWGLRAALQRYYSRSPEWFDERARHYGCWASGIPTDYSNFDPSVYAFHGSGSHSIHVKTLDEYVMNEAWRFGASHGIYNLAYMIPGQLEITKLKKLPANYTEAMDNLRTWTDAPRLFSGHNFPNSYPDANGHKQRIQNSGIFDADGRYIMRIRNTKWGGDSVTFPVNPNPRLFADSDKDTSGKYLLSYVRKMMASPYMNGNNMDSLGGFSAYYNYRHDHFAYEQVPLTYSDGVFKPAIFNGMAITEFLWEARELLHANGKFLSANDTQYRVSPPNPLKPLPFMTFALDIITSEGAGRIANVANPILYRMMTYRKPLMFLIGSDWKNLSSASAEQLFKNSVLVNFFLSSGPTTSPESEDEFCEVPPRELEYQRKYIPVLRLLAKAGWEPVTGVKTGDPVVLAERYGGPKEFYLVLYNTSGVEKRLALTVDRTIIIWPAKASVEEILSISGVQRQNAKALMENGRLTLAAGEELVLRVRPS